VKTAGIFAGHWVVGEAHVGSFLFFSTRGQAASYHPSPVLPFASVWLSADKGKAAAFLATRRLCPLLLQ
jgi:hypothetical protein